MSGGLRADEAHEATCALRDVLRRVRHAVAEGNHLMRHSTLLSLLRITTHATQAAHTRARRAAERRLAMYEAATERNCSAQRSIDAHLQPTQEHARVPIASLLEVVDVLEARRNEDRRITMVHVVATAPRYVMRHRNWQG